MRTNIELDDALIKEAMEVTGLATKRATVEEALKRLVRQARQRQALDAIRGTGWVGNLDEMREGRFYDDDL